MCSARSLISVGNVCACVYESSEASAYSFGYNPNPTRTRGYPLNINPKPDPKPDSISGPAGSGRGSRPLLRPQWKIDFFSELNLKWNVKIMKNVQHRNVKNYIEYSCKQQLRNQEQKQEASKASSNRPTAAMRNWRQFKCSKIKSNQNVVICKRIEWFITLKNKLAVTKLMWCVQCEMTMAHTQFGVNMSKLCRDIASDVVWYCASKFVYVLNKIHFVYLNKTHNFLPALSESNLVKIRLTI